MRDIVSKWGTLRSAGISAPAALTTATYTGTDIDLSGYNGCVFYIIAGAWTNGTHTFTIYEADDNGSGAPGAYTAVADSQLVLWVAKSASDYTPVKTATVSGALPAISSAVTAKNMRCGYTGGKRWVRIVDVVGAAANGAVYEVLVELGEPRLMPAAV